MRRVLVVAEIGKGTLCQFSILHDRWSDLRQIFDEMYFLTDMDRWPDIISRSAEYFVVVIGPAFLREFPGGERAIRSLLKNAGLPEKNLIVMREVFPGLGSVSECLGKTYPNPFDAIMKAVEAEPSPARV